MEPMAQLFHFSSLGSLCLAVDSVEAVGTVKWWPCGQDHLPGAECGYIIVPLDYLNTSVGIAKVALGRYKATKKPRKGMVLFNPGGPGGRGKPVATLRGPYMQSFIGTDYDFVGFDPRGIGETEPRVRCFGEDGNYQLFKTHTVLDRGFDVGPNLTDPRTRDNLLLQQREAESLYKTQFERCARTMGETLKYMGTTTVSRDIDFITTALEGEDALINFYGASYGSILGAYLVNMFPDRVGRVVIDGIADAVLWSSTPSFKWYRQWLGYTEKAYGIFLDECSKAGPRFCPLAESKHEDPSKIEKRITQFLADIYAEPLTVPFALRPGILTSGLAEIPLFTSLQRPTEWPLMSQALSQAIKGDGTALLNRIQGSFPADLERSAVSCNDNLPGSWPTNEEVIDESLDVLKTVSRFAMSVVTTEPDSGCQFWPVTPPERFEGPWNHTLKNPILIHSNTADPVTPLSSGEAIRKLLGNSSRLAIRQGPGHCSFSLLSLCTAKITRDYFKDGTLPEEGHICPLDETPFPDPESASIFSAEDTILLEHMQIVRATMDEVGLTGTIST
ncbi:alpha/beta-hydrolase [Ramaria rubella]|nr:alpha/beta-hydrolase [Ramaria rubella]